MQPALRFISAAALAFVSASSLAVTTTYNSSASFMGNVAAGAYTENFDGMVNPPIGSLLFSGGAFSFSAFAPTDLYLEGGFLGTNQIDEALTITFLGGNVTAIGANFFATDINDDFQAVQMSITLSDGTVETFTPTSLSNSYRGFVSDVAITSLVISAPGQSLYSGLDNLTVGGTVNAVPEPASWALISLGLAGLLASRRRGG